MGNEMATISGLQDPSPEFQEWVAEMEKDGFLAPILEAMATIDEKYYDSKEALSYLSRLSDEHDLNNLKLACADFKGNEKVAKLSMSKLRSAQNRKMGTNANFVCGLVGHLIMSRLVLGGIFKSAKRLPKMTPSQLTQLSLNFDAKDQMFLFDNLVKEAILGNPEAILGDFIDGRRIQKRWMQALDVFEKTNNQWPDWYWAGKKIIDDLLFLLSPLLGHHLQTILKLNSPDERKFVGLSILTWAAAVTYFRRAKPRIIFSEIPVLRYEDDIHGGRIDAIEVTEINGDPPSKKQERVLRQLLKLRFSSLPRLLYYLKLSLGTQDFQLEAGDWKFLVGDCGSKSDLLLPEDLPQRKHLEQIARYLLFCSFGQKMDSPEKYPDYWSGFKSGNLTYWLPNQEPFVHKIELGLAEKQHIYATQVLNRLEEAKRRAVIRNITNKIIHHIIGQLKTKGSGETDAPAPNGNATNGNKGKNGRNKKDQLRLFPEISAKAIISTHKEEHDKALVEINTETAFVPAEELTLYDEEATPEERKRIFVDSLQVIEQVGFFKQGEKKGQPVYHMNFAKLLEAIENEQLTTRRFNQKGGHVRCLMPGCTDYGPSHYVSLERKISHCFSCGASCFVVAIPPDIEKKLPQVSFHDIPGVAPGQAPVVTAQEHARVMGLVQMILHEQFKGSRAEEYLQERCIDQTLAFLLGAGYGNETFINELLDNGLSLDELIFFGLINISPYIGANQGLCPLLKKRGLKEDQIRRKTSVLVFDKRIKDKIKSEWGYPVSVLNNRVTFPLTLNGTVTSIYGRAIYPNPFLKHIKLYSGYTNVRHGAFNFDVMAAKIPYVIPTEAAIEALSIVSLMGLADNQAIGFVGTLNDLLINELIKSDKNIFVALNNDKPKNEECIICHRACPNGPGQKATKKIIELFEKSGQGHRISDLTHQFLALNPHLNTANFNDYNQLLIAVEKEGLRINIPKI